MSRARFLILSGLVLAVLAATMASISPSITGVLGKPNLRAGEFLGNYYSLNWAGYAMHSSTYTSASGSWNVPTLQTTSSGYSSAWVGVGGFSGSTVIQIGTEQDCLSGSVTGGRYHGTDSAAPVSGLVDSARGGSSGGGRGGSSCKPTYYAWWELYPENAEQKITTMSVSPGDSVSASVTQNSDGSWTLAISDATNGQSFTTTQTPTFVPDLGSAETIVERPALCAGGGCTLTNLANFGTISLTGTSSGTTQFSSTNSDSITMVDNAGFVLARPSSISSGAFSVQWYRSK